MYAYILVKKNRWICW